MGAGSVACFASALSAASSCRRTTPTPGVRVRWGSGRAEFLKLPGSQYPFTLLKLIKDPKELLFIWVISIHAENENERKSQSESAPSGQSWTI